MPTPSHLPQGHVRASDDEREQVAAVLREHASRGRLDVPELSDRLERAFEARTRAELAALVGDLPDVPAPRRALDRAPRRRELRGHVAAFVLVNLLLVAIWVASGAGYFWPVWSLLGWGIGMAKHASATPPGASSRFGARSRRGPAAERWAGS